MSVYKIPKVKIRMVRERAQITLQDSNDASGAVRHLCCENPSMESFCVLYINGRNQLIAGRLVAMGGASSLSVRAREIFQGACDMGAGGIILGHNHPSGSVNPSQEDREMTNILKKAGEILGIPVVDHVIVTECGKKYSFMDHHEL